MTRSQSRCLREEAAKDGIALETVQLKEGTYHSSQHLTILYLSKAMNYKCAEELNAAKNELQQYLQLKTVDESGKFFTVLYKTFLSLRSGAKFSFF